MYLISKQFSKIISDQRFFTFVLLIYYFFHYFPFPFQVVGVNKCSNIGGSLLHTLSLLSLSFSLSNTHNTIYAFSLSLSYYRPHTHTLCFFSIPLFPLPLSHTHTHAHTPSFFPSLSQRSKHRCCV